MYQDATEALLDEAVRLAREYLRGMEDRDQLVVNYLPPAELAQRLGLEIPAEGRPLEELVEDMRRTLQYSVRTGHPRYMNQLFGGWDGPAIVGEWITALLTPRCTPTRWRRWRPCRSGP